MIAVVGRVVAIGIALLALVGFVASLVVHVASLAGTNLVVAPAALWTMHGGIFVVFVPFVSAMALANLRKERESAFGRTGSIAFAVLLAYALGNFYWCIRDLDARGALTRAGRPATMQIAANDPVNARIFSGHWLLFYFAPLVYFGRRALLPTMQTP